MTSEALPPADLIARLRKIAAELLSLAKDHAEAESAAIAAKLTDAAGELEARAVAVEIAVSVVQRKRNFGSRGG
jgi:hypothetical protein